MFPIIFLNDMSKDIKKKKLKFLPDSFQTFLWLLLAGLTAALTLILFPNLAVQKHVYRLGDVAQRDIKAQTDFFIEDAEATRKNRKQAMEAVLTVYDHDTTLSANMIKRLHKSFTDIRMAVEEKQKDAEAEVVTADTTETTPPEEDKSAELHAFILSLKPRFEETLRISVSDGAYRILENEMFSKEVEDIIATVVDRIMINGVVANKDILLQEQDKGVVLRNVETGEERAVQALRQFYGPEQAKTMVRIIGQPLLENANYTVKGLIVDFAQRMVTPNITLNLSETKKRRKNAAEAVKPFLYQIKKGEMILREGERVTQFQLEKLDAMFAQTQDDQLITSRVGMALIILCLLLVGYIIFIRNHPVMTRDARKNLLFLSAALVMFLLLIKVSASLADGLATSASFPITPSSMYCAIPMAAGAMTVALFMGIELALPFAMLLCICSTVIFNNRIDFFIYFLLSSAMGAYWMRHCRERVVFIKAGLKLGLLNLIFITAVDVYLTDVAFGKLMWDWLFAFLGGAISGIVTAGLAPMVESAFGYTTDIKLLELVNLDRPILRRLMIEASGTYHHSVVVGSMVEAAASAINANPLLARVCGYYHDIGKIKKPLYFIENQTGGKNKHDKLAPSMSSLILISHIKDGVEIAKANKLGKAIIDTIQQHHGTSLISYFYEKAKQMKGEDAVNIDDFRYPGPKPQTREAGLVMLADVIEAASRTLENPTPSRIQGLVQKLINKIFSDGQLDNCELTLKDLHNIAKSFIKILDGIYHNRIEYPESTPAAAGGTGKGKNGYSDRQPPEQTDHRDSTDSAESEGHLKRLGQS